MRQIVGQSPGRVSQTKEYEMIYFSSPLSSIKGKEQRLVGSESG
jgi:hypothetical protein